jgi:hypothetical protein
MSRACRRKASAAGKVAGLDVAPSDPVERVGFVERRADVARNGKRIGVVRQRV